MAPEGHKPTFLKMVSELFAIYTNTETQQGNR